MDRETAKPNYLALLIVIAAGVAIGNLVADWIAYQVIAYRTGQAMSELSRSAATGATRARDAAIAQAQKAAAAVSSPQEHAREQRRRDRDGVRLFRPCEEWRSAHAQLNTDTTRAEMKKHCGLYERYVDHGILPAKK